MSNRKGILVGLALGLGLAGRATAAGQAAPNLIRSDHWQNLPAPDPQVLAWLASRMGGLDAKNVRTVTLETVDALMQRAIAAKATYLDLLSDTALQRGHDELFYVPQDALKAIDQKYVSGTFPAVGATKDGRPFQMQAIVAGAGSITFLYDQLGEFSFSGDGYDIKIAPGGKIITQIQGAGDIMTSGVSGCKRVVVYVCAEIQRTTKESEGKIQVQTSRGPQSRDISPIRLK